MVFHVINEVGHEVDLEVMAGSIDLPLLQDTEEADVWNTWAVTYRDVILLDASGAYSGVYNLTDNDLADPENLEALEALVAAARGDG